jgi:exonuclease III
MELGNNLRITNRDNNNIKIWQQNVNKSRICQHDLISSMRLIKKQIDIIALQELAISDFAVTITSRDWRVIYPLTYTKEPSKTRSVILIRADIHTNNWSQEDFDSGDITVIKLKGEWGALMLFNVYNNCKHDRTIDKIKNYQRTSDNHVSTHHNEETHTIWLGNFNWHHLYWDDVSDIRLFTKEVLDKAEKLISAVADTGLDFALPPKIPTHKHNVSKKWSRLDHVFLSEHLQDALISCEVLPDDLRVNTDHLPIVTNLDFSLTKAPAKKIANFQDVNWDKFRKMLEEELQSFGLPNAIKDQGELDVKCLRLTTALQSAIQKEVPITDLGPMSRCWWMKELTNL